MWAIIGGSGFENFEGFETIEELDRQTPFGQCSSGFRKVRLSGEEILFLSRHGASHELMPSEINFPANIFALKKNGASKIMSISAVGSLQAELKPGDLVVPSQYIDRTKSLRRNSFCGDGIVGHVSLAFPVQEQLVDFIQQRKSQFDFDIHTGRIQVVIEGPGFSTQAESISYRQLGADIIGMTNFPEYALAREAGVCYLPLSFVTDYDCWNEEAPHVTLAEVMAVMKANNRKAYAVAEMLTQECRLFPEGCIEEGLKNGIMTPYERIAPEKLSWLRVLTGN